MLIAIRFQFLVAAAVSLDVCVNFGNLVGHSKERDQIGFINYYIMH